MTMMMKGRGKMKKSNLRQWIKKAAVRAIKTMAQSAIAMIGTSVVIADINWVMVASATAVAGVLSLLTSIAGLPELEEV